MLVLNTMVIYHVILTLEKVGTAVNYHGILITLAKNTKVLEKRGTTVNYCGMFITAPGKTGLEPSTLRR
jgi:hypothetical protein